MPLSECHNIWIVRESVSVAGLFVGNYSLVWLSDAPWSLCSQWTANEGKWHTRGALLWLPLPLFLLWHLIILDMWQVSEGNGRGGDGLPGSSSSKEKHSKPKCLYSDSPSLWICTHTHTHQYIPSPSVPHPHSEISNQTSSCSISTCVSSPWFSLLLPHPPALIAPSRGAEADLPPAGFCTRDILSPFL